MRRFVAALGIFATWVLLAAQSPVLPGFPPGIFQSRGALDAAGGGGSCSQSTAFLARATTITVSADKTNYDTMICGLVTDGVFSKLDALYALAAPNSTASLLNLVSSSFSLVSHGSPTFTASTGYTGDSTTAFLDTQLTLSSASNYALSSASFSVYVRNSRTTGQTWAGVGACDTVCAHIAQWFPRVGGSQVGVVNDAAVSFLGTGTQAQGSWVLSRTGSTAEALYKNSSATAVNTASALSTFVPTVTMYILARNNGGSADAFTGDQIAFVHIGSAFTGLDAMNYMTRINTFMAAYGTNVY